MMERLLSHIRIPGMVKVRQAFPRPVVSDVAAAVRRELEQPEILGRIRPGDRVAVTAGSRGIANIVLILREVVATLKAAGAAPFVVPAMGSHGGATAAGQMEVLRGLGISEEALGVPIRATMDVVQIGTSAGGLPVYFDRWAATLADATVVVGRVKPHTSFRGTFESGLAKMMAVGLANQKGAEVCHAAGPGGMSRRIEDLARAAVAQSNVLFAVGILENAYDETSRIVALPREQIMAREPELLREARANRPRLPFERYDVLVVDEIGKNISGLGMDTNVINRFPTSAVPCEPSVQRIAVLDLTRETRGNFHGLGLADVCSARVAAKADLAATYPNPLTARSPESSKIPMVMPNDLLAIKAAIATCHDVDYGRIKMIRIKNTRELAEIMVSEHLVPEARPPVEIAGDPGPMPFAADGNLLGPCRGDGPMRTWGQGEVP